MQGQRSSVSTLPENISFDHGSTSSDASIGPQLPWSSMQTSAQTRLTEYMMSSSETNIPYLHVRSEGWNAEWNVGETSSSAPQNQGDENERKPEHTLNYRSRVGLTLDNRQDEPPNIPSTNGVNGNSNGNHTTHDLFLLQNSTSDAVPRDLNMSLGFGDQVDNESLVIEHPSAYKAVGTSNEQIRGASSSSVPHGVVDESEGRLGCSLDGHRVSCKRKTFEGQVGPSSGVGSSNSFQTVERNQWLTTSNPQIAACNIQMPGENGFVINNRSEQTNQRLRLGVGGLVSANPFSLTVPAGNAANSRRNFRLRFNNSSQQSPMAENPFPMDGDGNMNVPSSRYSSRLATRNRAVELNPPPVVENPHLNGQSVLLPVSSVRRSHPTRWSGASSTRASTSSTSAVPEERLSFPYEESMPRNIPRSISEHPMFIPAGEIGNISQTPVNWNLAGSGGNSSTPGNVAPTALVGSSTGASPSAPSWSRRGFPQYPRRLSEIVRRSLLPPPGTESGGQSSSNNAGQTSALVTSQEVALPSGSNNHRRRGPSSRSALWDRYLDGTTGLPYSLRTLAAASDGRSGIMSEIRHVLDVMRRGEGIRFEDMMMLDQTVFFGMADVHDRHRDMRLDVDNMSYEELLALEERIGNVCTGLNEETIMSRLKKQKYTDNKPEVQVEMEPCSICREEYNEGEDLGSLECGHNFHSDCIKQWLMQKNLCPICKTAGLTM